MSISIPTRRIQYHQRQFAESTRRKYLTFPFARKSTGCPFSHGREMENVFAELVTISEHLSLVILIRKLVITPEFQTSQKIDCLLSSSSDYVWYQFSANCFSRELIIFFRNKNIFKSFIKLTDMSFIFFQDGI